MKNKKWEMDRNKMNMRKNKKINTKKKKKKKKKKWRETLVFDTV